MIQSNNHSPRLGEEGELADSPINYSALLPVLSIDVRPVDQHQCKPKHVSLESLVDELDFGDRWGRASCGWGKVSHTG